MYSTYDLKEGEIRIGSRQELTQIDALVDALPKKPSWLRRQKNMCLCSLNVPRK